MRPFFAFSLAVAGCLSACTAKTVAPCGGDGGCPIGSFCLFNQCTGQVSNGLTAVVTPPDSAIPVEEFYPDQLVPQGGFITIALSPSQNLRGHVPLPASCTPANGFPVSFTFETPSAIPGTTLRFFFTSDAAGNIDAALPSGLTFTERVEAASPCTPPLLRTFVSGPGELNVDAGAFAFLGASDTLFVQGDLRSPSGKPLPVGADVRVVSSTGVALSNAAPLVLGSGRIGTFELAVPLTQTSLTVDAGCGTPLCSQFQILVAPSSYASDFPFMPLFINAPVTDGGPLTDGENRNLALVGGDAGILPMDPDTSVAVGGRTIDAYLDGGLLASVDVDILSVAGTFPSCASCYFVGRAYSDSAGSFSVNAPAGSYQLSMSPLLPLGGVDAGVDATAGPVSVDLVARNPGELAGSVLQPDGTALASGSLRIFALPSMNPIGAFPVNAGNFDVLIPPGNYLLLVQPDAATLLSTVFQDVVLSDGQRQRVTLRLPEPGQLAGIVELQLADGGLPVRLTGAFVQFFFVTSDPGSNQQIAIPVASAVTDSQGFYSTPGPPTGP